MGKISKALANHTLIGLDTSIFIYHFEGHPDYLDLTQEILAGVESHRWQGVTSVISLLELAVLPYRAGLEDAARKIEAMLVNFPNLLIWDVDREVAHLAARLHAVYHLRTPDALQAAACLEAGADILVTSDRALERLGPVLKVMVLEDYRFS